MESNTYIYFDGLWRAEITTYSENIISKSSGTYYLKDADMEKLITKVNRLLKNIYSPSE